MGIYNGTPGDDVQNGTAEDDTMNGGGGNDTLRGLGGDDTIDGGEGRDFLYGYGGADVLIGGAGDDVLVGYDNNNSGENGVDILNGGEGNDWLSIFGQRSLVAGSQFIGGAGFDTLYISGGSWEHFPTIDLSIADVTIEAERIEIGDAVVRMTSAQLAGFSQIAGIIRLTDSGNFDLTGNRLERGSIYLGDGNDTATLAGNVSNETTGLSGMGGDDILIGGESINALSGDQGNDRIEGGGGDDGLDGGSGNDIVLGGAGNDNIFDFGGVDRIEGGSGDDTIRTNFQIGDIIDGGEGNDYLIYDDGDPYTDDDVIDFSAGTLTSIERFYAPWYTVIASAQVLNGFQSLEAERVRFTTAGAFVVSGDSVRVNEWELSAGGNSLDFTAATSSSGYRVTGGAGNDVVLGSDNADTFVGNDGDDRLEGGRGIDTLTGGAGIDTVLGGDGDDTLILLEQEILGAGEVLDGGAGTDRLFLDGPVYGNEELVADISAATVAGLEILTGSGRVALRATVEQLATFQSSTLSAHYLANGGVLDLSGRAFQGVFHLNAAGNTLILAGANNRNIEVRGAEGDDRVTGSDNADTIRGGGGADELHGGHGDDILRGEDGADRLYGGAGVDFLIGGAGDDIVDAGDGNDTLTDDDGNDTYYGGGGDDVLTITATTTAADAFHGGAGYDRIEALGGGAMDLSALTIGSDIEHASASGELRMTAVQANQFLQITAPTLRIASGGDVFLRDGRFSGTSVILSDSGNAVDLSGTNRPGLVVLGGAGNDLIIGGSTAFQSLNGGGGNDTIIGSTFTDLIDGGAGDDAMYGGAGDDTYRAGSALDVVFEAAGGGTDRVISTASYYLYANVEELELTGPAQFGVGNDLANRIIGNGGANLLLGGDGDDQIGGGDGGDSIFGEAGNDVIDGGSGIDYLVGGAGNDMIDGSYDADAIYGEDGDDILQGGIGFVTDILVGGAGDDVLYGDSGEQDYDLMDGGSGNDTYYVDTGDDLTFEAANGGTDTVIADIAGTGNGVYLYANVENLILQGTTAFGVGNELDNRLTGSDSANWLLGGAGNDVINGGRGSDVLYGEGGADIFVFDRGTGGDVIGDFQAGVDRIDLSAFFSSFAQVTANMVEVNGATGINLGNGDTIVLLGVGNGALDVDDFILATGAGEADSADHIQLGALLPPDGVLIF